MAAAPWHAGLSAEEKDRLVHDFQNIPMPECPEQVICGVQSAMGTGVDLFAAKYVIFLEPFGSPASNLQAYQRAHRRGQEKPVYVYYIRCAGEDGVFAEQHLLKRADARSFFVDTIFENAEIKNLSMDDDERQ